MDRGNLVTPTVQSSTLIETKITTSFNFFLSSAVNSLKCYLRLEKRLFDLYL